jgi:hypothetical protein
MMQLQQLFSTLAHVSAQWDAADLTWARPQTHHCHRKGHAIMPTSHWSAARFPEAEPLGRGQGTPRRGGTHRQAW